MNDADFSFKDLLAHVLQTLVIIVGVSVLLKAKQSVTLFK